MKKFTFAKTTIAVMTTVVLGVANTPATVANEEQDLLKTVIDAERNATQKGIVEHVEVS